MLTITKFSLNFAIADDDATWGFKAKVKKVFDSFITVMITRDIRNMVIFIFVMQRISLRR